MNASNPYAAPKAAVADVEPELSLDKPIQVVRGVRLLWIALPLGLLGSIINLLTFDQPGISRFTQALVAAISLVIGIGIAVWVIMSADRGKNWARIVQLGFVCFGALSSLSMFVTPLRLHWSVWVLSLAQTGVTIAGVVFLFSPAANDWYGAMKRHRTRAS